MHDSVWSVLAGIVSGIFSGSISARLSVNRIAVRSDRSQRAWAGRDAEVIGGDKNVSRDHFRY